MQAKGIKLIYACMYLCIPYGCCKWESKLIKYVDITGDKWMYAKSKLH